MMRYYLIIISPDNQHSLSDVSQAINQVLVNFQKLRSAAISQWNKPNNAKEEPLVTKDENNNDSSNNETTTEVDDAQPKGNVVELQTYFDAIFDNSRQLQSKLSTMLSEIRVETNRLSTEASIVFAKMISNLGSLVKQYAAVLERFLLDFVAFHKTTCKLEYVLLALFSTLYTQGFCGSKEEEMQEGQPEEGVEGTGMGEGKVR